MAHKPLTARPLDFIYFLFFLIHIPATLLIDLHSLWPKSLAPDVTKNIVSLYISLSGDPLVAGANDMLRGTEDFVFAWFRSLLWLELLFQLPVFILGARGLWKDSPSIYVLLLVYGASTSTTLLPCLSTILAVPTVTTAPGTPIPAVGVSAAQRRLLLASYVPFMLIPLLMTLDMAWRVSGVLARRGGDVAPAQGRVGKEGVGKEE